MTPEQHGLAVLSGVVVGLVLSVVGGGGSLLTTPSLLYILRYPDVHTIIGTAALAVSMTAWWNLVPHWRSGHVSWLSAVVFTAPGVVGASAGGELGRILPGRSLMFLFSLLMLVVAGRMLRPSRVIIRPSQHDEMVRPARGLVLAGAGFAVGAMAGFFGIGGGFLAVPALVLVGRLPLPVAVGTSLLAVGAFAMTTGLGYAVAGRVEWPIAIEYTLGGAGGGYVGVRIIRELGRHVDLMSKLVGMVLLGVGLFILATNPPLFLLRLR